MASNDTREHAFPGPREDPLERTFLGSASLGARSAWFFFFVLIAAAIAGGALYVTDLRAKLALDSVAASSNIAQRVAGIEHGVERIRAEAQAFLANRSAAIAEIYRRESEGLAADLKSLIEDPAAIDGQRLAATLNDGITQHSEQFQNVARISTLLGGNDSGLIGNTRSSGAALERRVGEASLAFAQRVAALRKIEGALIQGGAAPSDKTLTDEINEFRRAVGDSALAASVKLEIDRLAEAYAADLGQLARIRTSQGEAIARLTEIDTYIAPSIEALGNFADEFTLAARHNVADTQRELRAIAAGGVGGALILILIAGLSLIRSLSHPMLRLAAASAELARGNPMVSIPVLGNEDATGTLARALTYFRENLIQADRLRKELELALQRADAAQAMRPAGGALPAPEPEPETIEPAAIAASAGRALPAPAEGREAGSQISAISRVLSETSQAASAAAGEAERTESMVAGLGEVAQKIEDVESLLASISDQMSLLAVQTALSDDAGDPRENLVVLADKRKSGNIGQSVTDRIDTIQNGTKRAIKSIQQIGRTIAEVNEIAVQFASDASAEALDAATELLRQSEDLRGMLDVLLTKIRAEGGGSPPLIPRGRQTERE